MSEYRKRYRDYDNDGKLFLTKLKQFPFFSSANFLSGKIAFLWKQFQVCLFCSCIEIISASFVFFAEISSDRSEAQKLLHAGI